MARALNQAERSEDALELLQTHAFVPCEGGEHAVAEQYMFAHHQLGRALLRDGQHSAALQHFRSAQVLPDSLGAGLWNEVMLVPHQYYEACCLQELGEHAAMGEICRHILELTIDYFSNMHLPELPVYQALVMKLTGIEARADHLLRTSLTNWTNALEQTDAGFFKTTPFFISYIDQSGQARIAHFRFLTGMAKVALGDTANALVDFRLSVENDPSRLYPLLENSVLE